MGRAGLKGRMSCDFVIDLRAVGAFLNFTSMGTHELHRVLTSLRGLNPERRLNLSFEGCWDVLGSRVSLLIRSQVRTTDPASDSSSLHFKKSGTILIAWSVSPRLLPPLESSRLSSCIY